MMQLPCMWFLSDGDWSSKLKLGRFGSWQKRAPCFPCKGVIVGQVLFGCSGVGGTRWVEDFWRALLQIDTEARKLGYVGGLAFWNVQVRVQGSDVLMMFKV